MRTVLSDAVSVTVLPGGERSPGLRVALVDPEDADGRRFVVAMGYAAWLDDFELQRFRLLARELRARLVVVETPGHGTGTGASRLTAAERRALLLRADLRPVAERMLAAAVAADPALLDAPVGVIGYSLGSSLGTAMAQVLLARTGAGVPALVLVEPVAGRRWRPLDLVRATRAEDRLVDVALAENVGIAGVVEPWDRRPSADPPRHDRLDLLLLANALRAGDLAEQVARSRAALLVVVHGAESRLSLPAAVGDVLAAARAAGTRTEELEMRGSHGLWHSLPSVRRLARFVVAALEGDA